tara:strand:- start:153 stop:1451 length:1299 start_codon:yes stop_codon:yes gene_type:complete
MANDLQSELTKRNLGAIYGIGSQFEGDALLAKAGLEKVAGGGFNSVWRASTSATKDSNICNVLPSCILESFLKRRLVIRLPHGSTPWMSFEDVVGEATNMLFTALCSCGPQVAALSYARKLFPDKDSNVQGKVVVKYKLFAFLDCASMSVANRFSPQVAIKASAIDNKSYHAALISCIYDFSVEGFVHLDATLRNFVDFYDVNMQDAFEPGRVRVIDVEQKSFRRLCGDSTVDWSDIFLVNLLIVLVFLKGVLGNRWQSETHWNRVRDFAKFKISKLDSCTTLPAILYWKGAFVPDEPFPDMTVGKYVGDTHEASMHFLIGQMRYYLLQQPIEQGTALYTKVLKSQTSTQTQIQKAKVWYDSMYKKNLYPMYRYFLDELPSKHAQPRRFVSVMFDFLDASPKELQDLHCSKLGSSNDHFPSSSREYMLGIMV